MSKAAYTKKADDSSLQLVELALASSQSSTLVREDALVLPRTICGADREESEDLVAVCDSRSPQLHNECRLAISPIETYIIIVSKHFF